MNRSGLPAVTRADITVGVVRVTPAADATAVVHPAYDMTTTVGTLE